MKRLFAIRVARLLCCALLAALIVQGLARMSEARQSDSVTIFHCDFGDDWDVNYDGWPDRWDRKTGGDYPHYVNATIHDDDEATGKKCLKIDLDGAAASVSTPPIAVLSRFSYVFEAQVKNEGLKHSVVVLSLDFCDSAGHVLQTAKTEPIAATNGWKTVRIGPMEPRDRSVDHAIVSLTVVRGAKGDLQGHVSLADVWLERLPRIDVATNNPCNVYTELTGVSVKCSLSGIRERDPEIDFQLLDGSNRVLQTEHFRLDGKAIVNKAKSGPSGSKTDEAPDGYEGTISWEPKIPDYGFYHVAVRMLSLEGPNKSAGAQHQPGSHTIDLVVAPPLDMPRRGEFGWTLPENDQPLSFQDLSRLLPQVGVNWAKVPVWFDTNDQQRGDELIRFVELLGASNIDVVGIVDRPPGKATIGGRSARDMSIADILSQDTSVWSTALEPVMSRLALRVRWWQLGRDYDISLINQPKLNKRIEDVRTALFRFGQDVRLGLCADWDATETHTGNVSWDFAQLSLQTAATEKKFESLLAKPRANSALRWIAVDPPAGAPVASHSNDTIAAMCTPLGLSEFAGGFSIPAWVEGAYEGPRQHEADRLARCSAFVHRLVSAKLRGADAIIAAKPFDDENGLMRSDGMPAELLLPWRTTAAMLGGAQYLGRLQLPNDSSNEVFLRPDAQVVMVVWNERPTREVLYLGDNVRRFDMLGRSTVVPKKGRDQSIEVTSTPSFVLGLNEAIARWRMSLKFETTQIPSIFSRPCHDSLTFKNFFPQGVGGTAKIVVLQDQDAGGSSPTQAAGTTSLALDRWLIEPPKTSFQLAAGAETKFPFEIKLKNAFYGRQPIRIDFTVEADERLQFSAYGQLEVGTKDLTLDVRSHLDQDGTLIVEQFMTNHEAHLADFKCYLRSKGYRPQRMQVYRLGREPDRKVYRFPEGADLVGKEMLLEIEEVNGQRVLKYRFVASDHVKVQDVPEGDEAVQPGEARKTAPNGSPPPLAKLGS